MTSEVGLTSHELQRRAREDEEHMKAAGKMATEMHTLSSLLTASGLEHMFAALRDKVKLDELQSRLLANRPMFLEHLRSLGIDKLAERQKLANQIGRAEKAGLLPPPVRRYPHLEPPVYDEEDGSKETITLRLKVPAGTAPNQLKVNLGFDRVEVLYCGGATAANGKLCGSVDPSDCTWQLERSQPPEYEPLLGAAEQPPPPDDTLVISLQKSEPGRWKGLFADAVAKRYVPPPRPKTERELAQEARDKEIQHEKDLLKRDMLHGRAHPGVKPRGMDFSGGTPHWRSHRIRVGETGARNAPDSADKPQLAAREHWQSARAAILWRRGATSVDGEAEHSEGSEPWYTWVETESELTLSARTERGLPPSELSLQARPSSVDCHVRGRATPWCGFLVGHIDPARCCLEVLTNPDEGAVWDTLQLTLAKVQKGRLWRTPWQECLSSVERRERKSALHPDRPRRYELMASDGWDETETDQEWELTLKIKAGPAHDDLRVAVTTNPPALNVHLVGLEDEPLVGGELFGKIVPERSSWHVRAAKSIGSMKVEEIVVRLGKESAGRWRGLIKKHYV